MAQAASTRSRRLPRIPASPAAWPHTPPGATLTWRSMQSNSGGYLLHVLGHLPVRAGAPPGRDVPASRTGRVHGADQLEPGGQVQRAPARATVTALLQGLAQASSTSREIPAAHPGRARRCGPGISPGRMAAACQRRGGCRVMGRAEGPPGQQGCPGSVIPATDQMPEVLRASARVISGRMEGSRLASMDLPEPGRRSSAGYGLLPRRSPVPASRFPVPSRPPGPAGLPFPPPAPRRERGRGALPPQVGGRAATVSTP